MTQLNPYLTFGGNCREAMTFYQECLGGELSLMSVGESPTAAQMPPEAQNHIIHSSLTNGNLVLMGSDALMGSETTGPEGMIKGNTISLSLTFTNEEEVHTVFNKLAVGGEVTYPVQMGFWGGLFGTLTDKYGLDWLFNTNPNTQA